MSNTALPRAGKKKNALLQTGEGVDEHPIPHAMHAKHAHDYVP